MRCTMNLRCLNVIIFNVVCVAARSGGHGGGHGGGHSGGHGHGGFHSYSGRGHVSMHHPHYSYHPPSHIQFTCRQCSQPITYPVYHGQPPTYVYKYRETSGRYSDLLTGLALYNLGRSSGSHDYHHSYSHYHTTVPDEKCSLQVIDKTHFEETPFDCVIMSSFLNQAANMNTYSNATRMDITSSQIPVQPPSDNGFRLRITNSQECMLWHNRTMVKERKDVPCALLKQYADTMKPSGVPVYIWLPTLIGIVITISLCCQCWKKKKEIKEEAPLNQDPVIGYRSNIRIE